MDQTRLRGKRAIITGAGSGIGRATAIRFAKEGARVAAIDIDERGVKETVAMMGGGAALALVADVSREDQIEKAVKKAVDAFGGLDVVISNAGIAMLGKDDRVDRIALDTWQRMIDVNLTGMFLTCKHGLRALLASGGGAVVCTTSPTGLYGIAPEQAAYSASKAGIYALVRVMAAAYGKENIRANGVMPGYIKTALTSWVSEEHEKDFNKMVPIGRAGVPDDIASVMAFLASDEASYVTGAVYVADGGWTAI